MMPKTRFEHSEKTKEKMRKSKLGELNPRWNNNASEYQDPAILKKKRLDVLKRSGGKCEVCGEAANLVHHIDGGKSDHSLGNLVALCNGCHGAIHKNGDGKHTCGTSKYIRKYGMTLKEISHKLNMSMPTIIQFTKDPEKEKYIKDSLEIQ